MRWGYRLFTIANKVIVFKRTCYLKNTLSFRSANPKLRSANDKRNLLTRTNTNQTVIITNKINV